MKLTLPAAFEAVLEPAFIGAAAALLLAGCGSTSALREYVPQIVTPYRIDIQQGNFVTQDMVEKLQAGQTREQVRFILGTPMLTDMFHAERWDYVFRSAKGWNETEKRRLTVFFGKEDRLLRWEAIAVPPAVDLTAGATVSASTLPPEESVGFFGRMLGWNASAKPAASTTMAAAATTSVTAAATTSATAAATTLASAPAAPVPAPSTQALPVPAAVVPAPAPIPRAMAEPVGQASRVQAPAAPPQSPLTFTPPLPVPLAPPAGQVLPIPVPDVAPLGAQGGGGHLAAAAVPLSGEAAVVMGMVERWRTTWEARNVADYLAFYTAEFAPLGMTRKRWEAQRKERFGKAASILVKVSDPQVTLGADKTATVIFTQHYEADALKETGRKTLVLANVDGNWLIREERFRPQGGRR